MSCRVVHVWLSPCLKFCFSACVSYVLQFQGELSIARNYTQKVGRESERHASHLKPVLRRDVTLSYQNLFHEMKCILYPFRHSLVFKVTIVHLKLIKDNFTTYSMFSGDIHSVNVKSVKTRYTSAKNCKHILVLLI